MTTLTDTPVPRALAPEPLPSPAAARLAVDGGVPVVPGGILHSRWPRVDDDDVDAVLRTLRGGLLTEMSGRDLVREFEAEMAMWLGVRYALTTNSGTAALHCALAGLGVQAGDEVVVPSLSYIACAAAVLHQGAIPAFADVDPRTYNVTAATLEAAITERTRALMVVHLHGLPAPLDELLEVGRRHGIPVLEDFSQAAGAAWRGKPVGSCGAAGAASLMAGKNLPAAGEGGVVCTPSREVRNRAATLKCFAETVEADGSYAPLHETAGWNYRMGLLSLVFASRQLFRLDAFNDRRREGAARLDAVLREIPGFSPPEGPAEARHVYHMYRFRFDPADAGLPLTADQAREGLKQVFWAEGLPLMEFQNVPLPGHALLQGKVGYGNGAPWSCFGRRPAYRIEDHPGALDALRHSLVVGYPAQAPLANPAVVDAYAQCFAKLGENLDAFARFAAGLPADAPPWSHPARLF
ncbi:MAG TPA: DegT/DnrJ/EryC1/StrS family aminotransferase [Longimicrobium sp.]|nr:DegT/DnrJ/EryC1/StrS family aminotransferase [Longimicrobium sp.]